MVWWAFKMLRSNSASKAEWEPYPINELITWDDHGKIMSTLTFIWKSPSMRLHCQFLNFFLTCMLMRTPSHSCKFSFWVAADIFLVCVVTSYICQHIFYTLKKPCAIVLLLSDVGFFYLINIFCVTPSTIFKHTNTHIETHEFIRHKTVSLFPP